MVAAQTIARTLLVSGAILSLLLPPQASCACTCCSALQASQHEDGAPACATSRCCLPACCPHRSGGCSAKTTGPTSRDNPSESKGSLDEDRRAHGTLQEECPWDGNCNKCWCCQTATTTVLPTTAAWRTDAKEDSPAVAPAALQPSRVTHLGRPDKAPLYTASLRQHAACSVWLN